MEGKYRVGIIKEKFDKDNTNCDMSVHVVLKEQGYRDRGFTGRYTPAELVKWYGDCECEHEYWEKEFGYEDDGRPVIGTLDCFVVYAEKDYHEEIMKEREKNEQRRY